MKQLNESRFFMNMLKGMLGLWALISSMILIIIGIGVFLAFSENVYLKTDDGKETSYFKKIGMIHYRDSANAVTLVYNSIGADSKTFKPLAAFAAKDKEFIYYFEKKQPHVDYDTFEITSDKVMRDKNFVYDTYNYSHLLQIIDGADPLYYRKIAYGIGKDDKSIFYLLKKQPHVDYETFEVIFEEEKTPSGHQKIKIIKDKTAEYQTDYENQLLVKKPGKNR